MELVEKGIQNLFKEIERREENPDDMMYSYLVKAEANIKSWMNLELASQIDTIIENNPEYSGFSVYPRQKINAKKFDMIIYSQMGIRYVLEMKSIVNWMSPYEQLDRVISDIDRLIELEVPKGCEKIIILMTAFAKPKKDNLKKYFLRWMDRELGSNDYGIDKELFYKKITERLKIIRRIHLLNLPSIEIKNDIFESLILQPFYSNI
ncbi:MAG: hypothetical protein H7A25_17340 [Leptospiraceae bacterium]|nr:hypothetical protein [Leptospiraceae bacterium]